MIAYLLAAYRYVRTFGGEFFVKEKPTRTRARETKTYGQYGRTSGGRDGSSGRRAGGRNRRTGGREHANGKRELETLIKERPERTLIYKPVSLFVMEIKPVDCRPPSAWGSHTPRQRYKYNAGGYVRAFAADIRVWSRRIVGDNCRRLIAADCVLFRDGVYDVIN